MGARPERGAYGNARGKPDKQLRAKRNRENSPRHQAAREEVERNNAELAKLASQARDHAYSMPVSDHSMTSIRERMEEKHLEAIKQAAAEAEKASPSAVPAGRHYAACHCSHAGHPDSDCKMCSCQKYRPVTAPDPQQRKIQKIQDVNELLTEGKASQFDDTVKLANRIEELLFKLKEAVLEEDRKLAEERAREAARDKVRSRMAELQEEMDRLKAELGNPKIEPVATKSKTTRKPYDGPELACPECGRKDFKAPQGLGAHRFRAHDVRGTSHNGA